MNLSAHALKDILTITNSDAAELLFEPDSLNLLLPFLQNTLSIKEASETLELPFMKTHYQVKKFCKLGLLEYVDSFMQQGRKRKRYRASAKSFFVPFKVTKSHDLKGFLKQQDAPWYNHMINTYAGYLVKGALKPEQMGVHLGLTKTNHFRFSLTDDPTAPKKSPFPDNVYATSDESFKLSFEDAVAMKQEIATVLQKYREKQSGQAYVVRYSCVPLNDGKA